MDVVCLVSLNRLLLKSYFFLDIIYFPSEDTICSTVTHLKELISQAELFELKIWCFPSNPDYVLCKIHNMTDELIQCVISVGNQKNRTFFLPVLLVVKE